MSQIIFNIERDIAGNRFLLKLDNERAYLEYVIDENLITLLHTYVPVELEGRGAGSALVKHALHFASQNNLKVKATCEFAQSYISKNINRYKELL